MYPPLFRAEYIFPTMLGMYAKKSAVMSPRGQMTSIETDL